MSKRVELAVERSFTTISFTDTNGRAVEWKLFELTGTQRDAYLSKVQKMMSFGPDGKPAGVKQFDGLQTALLVDTVMNDEGIFLSADALQKLPSRVVDTLFKLQQEQSGLDKDAEQQAKND